MSTQLDLVVKAKSEFDATFRSLQQQLDGTKQKVSGVDNAFRQFAEGFKSSMLAGVGIGAGFAAGSKAADLLIGSLQKAALAVAKLGEEAERIQNRALVTGFSTDAVQSLDRLAKNAGIDGEAIFAAISKMQRAAVEGSKGFDKLGMSTAQFLALSPEKELQAAAQAIMALPTPAERAALAMELFGRAGAQLLPVLAQVAEGTSDNVGMTEEQVAAMGRVDSALDKLGGAWEDLGRQLTVSLATNGDLVKDLTEIAGAVAGLARTIREHQAEIAMLLKVLTWGRDVGKQVNSLANATGELIAEGLTGQPSKTGGMPTWKDTRQGGIFTPGAGIGLPNAAAEAREFARELGEVEKAGKKARDEAKKAADAARRADEEWAKTLARYKEWDLAEKLKAAHEALEEFGKSLPPIVDDSGDFLDIWGQADKLIAGFSFGTHLKVNLKDALRDLPNVVMGALQGGGNVGESIGALFGQALGQSVAEKFGETLAKSLGKELGGALGSALPGLGSILGAGLGGLLGKGLGALGGVFGIGGDKEVMKVNDLRDAFFKAQGGFEAFARTVRSATDQDLIRRIFDARTVDEFNAAVAQTMDFLDLQNQAQEELNATIEKYGFTIEELGPRFAQQRLDEQGAQLLKEWELLIAAGVDANNIIARMGPSFNEYVQQVIRAGGTLPEQMRPIIQSLIDQGLLVDSNGQAYENLEQTGLRFTESLTESTQRLIDRIGDLVNALLGIPNIDRTVTITTNRSDNSNDRNESDYDPLMGPRPPGYTGPWPPMARGGVVHGNVLPFVPRAQAGAYVPATPGGKPFIAGEGGGDEVIAPVRALFGSLGDSIASKVAAAARGGGVQHIHLHLNGREIASWLLDSTRTGHVLQDAAGSRARG